jgi:hypothetical protein
MGVQSADRSCLLRRFEFPKYREEIVENLESSAQALARIKQLYASYEATEGEGISFFLENDRGDQLHVGCSDEGWTLTHDPKQGTVKAAVGDSRARGYKGFLIPEWADFERKHLIAPIIAEAVVKLWVETGQLSDAVTWVQ